MKRLKGMLVVLVLLTLGCGSGRQGLFLQGGGGLTAIHYTEDWQIGSGITSKSFERSGFERGGSGHFRVGWGLTKQLLISVCRETQKLATNGLGITFFRKPMAPSLFADVVFNDSKYGSQSRKFEGNGFRAGIGYEFRRNWTIQVNFSHGKHNYFRNPGAGAWSLDDVLGVFSPDLYSDETGSGKQPVTVRQKEAITSAVNSLGFTVNYIWY